MKKLKMDLLKGIEEQENAIDNSKTYKETREGIKEKTSMVAVTQNISQDIQKLQTATEPLQSIKNIPKEEKAENKANTKQKKQVFSFRAVVKDTVNWKAYATATGQTMEAIGTAALNEYLANHTLTGTEKIIFEAMKEKNENK